MRAAPTIDVTYTGTDEPFIDRIYGTRLTFEHGQTRALAPELAERFLRHADVFKGPETTKAAADQPQANASGSTGDTTTGNGTTGDAKPDGDKANDVKLADGTTGDQKPADQTGDQQQTQVDDTAAQLAEAERLAEEQRKLEESRFETHQTIDKMNRKESVRDFIKANFKQEAPADAKLADLKAQAKSLVDQFGTP